VAIVLFLFLIYNDAIGLCDGAQLFGINFKSWLDIMYRARVGVEIPVGGPVLRNTTDILFEVLTFGLQATIST
jgi:hypothetical protein